ncbi:MAG: chromosomal replication initiator protein DnaA [Synergistaceae bacterium]|nr:chromosomal replication initiator protein DnaA [Synergistaceae bacterium]
MDKNVVDIWLEILNAASSKFDLTDAKEEPWLRTCTPILIEDGMLVLDVPNVFAKERIANRFMDVLNKAANFTGKVSGVTLRINENMKMSEKDKEVAAAEAFDKPRSNSNLNPAYVFRTFIVGKSNRLANAASLAVAESPGEAYNPLFIWGGPGLGKTHLMHAICQYALEKRSTLAVNYASSEQFINEFISSIRSGKVQEFKNRYRNADILLIDDIQFLGGKDGSQEEFFHTFNSLREANRQVVICSDRPPREFRYIEERLISRFEWGLVTDIQPPDFEMRIAILQQKAQARGYTLDDQMLEFLAQNMSSNIRELEGALNKVIASSELSGEPITIENSSIWLKDVLRTDIKPPTTIERIQTLVSEEFQMSISDLSSSKRTAEVALARQVAMYLCCEHTKASLHQTGLAFNKKDHTTVIHARKKIERLLENDENIKRIVENIRKKM